MTAIPAEIAHLDFNPDTDPVEQFTPMQECSCRSGPRDIPTSERPPCPRPAIWLGVMRCCMVKFHSCNYHKKRGENGTPWRCFRCKRERTDDWVGWVKL